MAKCNCPKDMRNGHGHHKSCPAYAEAQKKMNEKHHPKTKKTK